MKIRFYAGLAALLLAPVAWSGEWYGDVTYMSSDGNLPQSPIADVDNSDSGWQLSAGYEVNKHFSLEVGYVDYGRQTVNTRPLIASSPNTFFNPFSTAVVTVPPPLLIADPDPVTGPAFAIAASPPSNAISTETTGIRLASIGKLPLSQAFALNLQAGALVPRYKMTRNFLVVEAEGGMIVDFRNESHTDTSSEPEIFLGLGVHWSVNPTMGVKLFWEKINDLGNEDTLEQDLDTYNLSLRYQF